MIKEGKYLTLTLADAEINFHVEGEMVTVSVNDSDDYHIKKEDLEKIALAIDDLTTK